MAPILENVLLRGRDRKNPRHRFLSWIFSSPESLRLSQKVQEPTANGRTLYSEQ